MKDQIIEEWYRWILLSSNTTGGRDTSALWGKTISPIFSNQFIRLHYTSWMNHKKSVSCSCCEGAEDKWIKLGKVTDWPDCVTASRVLTPGRPLVPSSPLPQFLTFLCLLSALGARLDSSFCRDWLHHQLPGEEPRRPSAWKFANNFYERLFYVQFCDKIGRRIFLNYLEFNKLKQAVSLCRGVEQLLLNNLAMKCDRNDL